MLSLYNTLTRAKEPFKPLEDNLVRMYSCGPTVYDYPHIGNLRTYIMVDILKRYLSYKGYTVKHVMNITDVGHLTSDADEGEDKLEKGAKREGKSVEEIAEFYTKIFEENLQKLNIIPATYLIRATDHIDDQIALIKRLEEKGAAYDTPEAVYFDVATFPDYTRLSGQALEEKIVGARDEVHTGSHKRNPQDFALWFKRTGKFANHIMHWPSPWGDGFPGWHIECSAMSMKYLGETFDIHTGGVDHISVHHTNEIAQSQAATGKPLAKFWVHGEFLSVEGKKMAKSAGTFITLDDIRNKGFDPIAFRLLVLQAHYRSKLNFTWDALAAAQENLRYIRGVFKHLLISGLKPVDKNMQFEKELDDDLNTPRALSVFYEHLSLIANPNFDREKLKAVLLNMDSVLGLGLESMIPAEVIEFEGVRVKNETAFHLPESIKVSVKQREEARKAGNWQQADALRNQLEEEGYLLEDTPECIVIKSSQN